MTAGQHDALALRSTTNVHQHSYAYKKSSPHAILKSFADDLSLLPIGPRTEQAYYACIRQLSEFSQKSPELISPEEIRQYCIHLKTEKKVARQTSTQAICAIKIFWEKTLKRTWPHELELVRANPQFKLPVVLSAAEVRKILAHVPQLDHRVALATIYSCGLRLGEGLRLQVRDIDSERMFLHIRAGKGNQDRYVPLPERTLHLLREQWKTHRHPTFIFPAKGHSGQGAATATEPMCRSTLQRALRLALKASGVKKDAHIHTLRHSLIRSPPGSLTPAGLLPLVEFLSRLPKPLKSPRICWSRARTSARSRSTSATEARWSPPSTRT